MYPDEVTSRKLTTEPMHLPFVPLLPFASLNAQLGSLRWAEEVTTEVRR